MVEISSASSFHDQVSWNPRRKGTKTIRFTTKSKFQGRPMESRSREILANHNKERSVAIYSNDGGRSSVAHRQRKKKGRHSGMFGQDGDFDFYKHAFDEKPGSSMSWFKIENYLPNPTWFEPRPTIDRVVGLTLHCFALSVVVLSRALFKFMVGLAHLVAFHFLHSAIENQQLSVISLPKETVGKSSIARMGNLHLIIGRVDNSGNLFQGYNTTSTSLVYNYRRNKNQQKQGNDPSLRTTQFPHLVRPIKNANFVISLSSDSTSGTKKNEESEVTIKKNASSDDVILSEIPGLDDDNSDAAFDLSDGSTVRLTLNRPCGSPIALYSRSSSGSSASPRYVSEATREDDIFTMNITNPTVLHDPPPLSSSGHILS